MKYFEPRKILFSFSPLLSLQGQIRPTGQYLVFPFYHAVNDNPGPHLKNLYRIKSEKEFKRDLDELLKYFKPLSPDILLKKGIQKFSQPVFILSFDDGLREVYDIISPILIQKGIPAIFFLNNNFIDNKELFYRYKASIIIDKMKKEKTSFAVKKEINKILAGVGYIPLSVSARILSLGYNQKPVLDKISDLLEIDMMEYLSRYRPYMNSDEIIDLKNKGFYLGGHSFDHPEFSAFSQEKQREEIFGSTKEIVDHFMLEYNLFAFPFSDYGVSASLFSNLYKSRGGILDASFGTAGFRKQKEYPHYQRVSMEKLPGDSKKILITEYLYFRIKKLAGKGI